jgi:hypothetical protein
MSKILSSFLLQPSKLLLLLALPWTLAAQTELLTVSAPPATGKKSEPFVVRVNAQLKAGLHCNTNKPNDELLIPLKLTLDKGGFDVVKIDYPAGKNEKYSFSDQPLNVYSGAFSIGVTLKAQPGTPAGLAMAGGKLRYQACSDTMCFPPKTVDVRIPIDLR